MVNASCVGKTLSAKFDADYVLLGVFCAFVGSFVGLMMAKQARVCAALRQTQAYKLFIVGAGVTLGGSAIWTMHFIGSEGLTLRDCEGRRVRKSYEVTLTAASFVVAMVCATIAMHLVMPTLRAKDRADEAVKQFITVNNDDDSTDVDDAVYYLRFLFWNVSLTPFALRPFVLSSALLTVGVLAMHNIGQLAQRGSYTVVYSPLIIALSGVVGCVVAATGLFIVIQVSAVDDPHLEYALRVVAAAVIAGAVNVVHYVGMHAAEYTLRDTQEMAVTASTTYMLIAAPTLAIASLSLNITFLSVAQHYSTTLIYELQRQKKAALSNLPDNVQEIIDSVYEWTVSKPDAGEVTSHIPELANVDPSLFGVALCDNEGQLYTAGDVFHCATMQAVSSTMLYVMALEDNRPSLVDLKIGGEPSTGAFYEIAIDDRNRAYNPLINTGALVAASLVKGETAKERFKRFAGLVREMGYAPSRIKLNGAAYESEMATNAKNRAIVDELVARNVIESEDDDESGGGDVALDFYTRACSLELSCDDLATVAATLAFDGRNPVTGNDVISPSVVGRLVTNMMSCGMHADMGKWIVEVGVPAKSGVGGFVMGLVPGVCGFAVFSPRLNEHANPHRGILVAEALSKRLGLHVLRRHSTQFRADSSMHVAKSADETRRRRQPSSPKVGIIETKP